MLIKTFHYYNHTRAVNIIYIICNNILCATLLYYSTKKVDNGHNIVASLYYSLMCVLQMFVRSYQVYLHDGISENLPIPKRYKSTNKIHILYTKNKIVTDEYCYCWLFL